MRRAWIGIAVVIGMVLAALLTWGLVPSVATQTGLPRLDETFIRSLAPSSSDPVPAYQREETLYDAPEWTAELDQLATQRMFEHGKMFPMDCYPDPPDFDPGSVDELFFGLKFVLPHRDPDGGAMRIETQIPSGLSTLRMDHEITGFIKWDVHATPQCVLMPGPTPRARFTIPDWDPEWTATLCTTTLDVSDDGEVDEVVQLDGFLDLRDGYACRLRLHDGDQLVGDSIVGLEPDSPPPEFHEPVELGPPPTPTQTLQHLQDKLERIGKPGDPLLSLFDLRIEVLEHLVEVEPALRPTLQPRLEAIRDERARAKAWLINDTQSRIDRILGP